MKITKGLMYFDILHKLVCTCSMSALPCADMRTMLFVKPRSWSKNLVIESPTHTKTKDDNINIRATIHNKITREMCIKYDWIFMDNSNINIHQLRENVHLNRSGKEMFIQNMSETTKKL
jgi:hypothetical protein